MTNTKEYLAEYFKGTETVKDEIVLAVTAKGFKKLVEQMEKSHIAEELNIVNVADNVYVTNDKNVIIKKSVLAGVNFIGIALKQHIMGLINNLFIDPKDYHFMYIQHDGTTMSKGKLTDPAFIHEHSMSIFLAHAKEMTPEGLKQTMVDEDETYLEIDSSFDPDVSVSMQDYDTTTDNPHLRMRFYDDTLDDAINGIWNVAEVIQMRDAMNKFIAKHTR